MSTQCPACSRDDFTVTGLSQHLAKSRNPHCRALYHQSRSQVHTRDQRDEPDEPTAEDEPGYEVDEFGYEIDEPGYEVDEPGYEAEAGGEAEAGDEDDDEGWNFEPEWEPPVEDRVEDATMDAIKDLADEDEAGWEDQRRAHQDIQAHLRAGQQITRGCAANAEYEAHLANEEENVYHPFASKMEWEVARWAKLRGLSSTALSDLLAIEGGDERLSLSFKNANELNTIVDHGLLTGRPKFKREQIVVAGEAFDIYYRDVIECVKSLYGDPDFAKYLAFAPERHYSDEDETIRLFHDMHTGKWWWDTQKKLDKDNPGGTIIPIIISSDKTQVTLFRNKSVYPVYLTIGNIPKEIRRKPSRGAHILLAYLPCTRLQHITNKASRRRTLANLYHACLRRVLAPLKSIGVDGLRMASGDGALRPSCDWDQVWRVPKMRRGRGRHGVLDALAALDEGNLSFVRACAAAGIKPIVHPFWEDLPFTNIFRAITPDVLHQLYQGLIKHLLGWLSAACGGAEIDARCRRLPPNHHIHLFSKGITCLSRISGTEHAQICRFLLGIVIGIRLPNNLNAGRLLRAVQGLLDFLYLAQYPCHSLESLQLLDDALDLFHKNKDIFIDLGIRSNFDLPKLHAARHYSAMIMMFGTTDNYNTEYTERLHIDFAKDAYRATNHKDEFVQMTRWLERKEKIMRHDKYINWRCAGAEETMPYHSRPPNMTFRRLQSVSKHPTAKAVSIDKLIEDYGATYFREALARYITQLNHASDPIPLRSQTLDVLAQDVHFPFRTLPVFHRVKWLSVDARGHGDATATLDSVHARPQCNSGSSLRPRRSDTALDGVTHSRLNLGVRVGQVRVIFSLPSKSVPLLVFANSQGFPLTSLTSNGFEPFTSAPDRHHGLYKLSRSLRGGGKSSKYRAIGQYSVVPREWTSDTVLDNCNTFWLNSYIDRYTFSLFK
ncbi:hypothetical protein DFJ58DRAFT_719762 [Suillus subalutaceus]|uniref:uncharacterized protein n=1 Tax=Suillus subalutaceus TaxID=48586 RepID=UPI001B880E0E|nr:uncharacterized protein DFJ58DRAFT_719762 [Suillus subalutaceus]KAG1828883.1 hypothetical protein DFJ58DRAFT_719762 [Suillus subalutaceus]